MADYDFISGALAGQQFQLNKFAIAEAPVKLESEKLALTITKQDQEKQQRLADMLAAKPPEAGKNPLENAMNFFLTGAQDAAKAGLPQQATEYLAKGANLAVQQEDAAYRNWEKAFKENEFAQNILSTATDEASWNRANDTIEMMTGKPSHFKGTPYSAQFVEQLKQAGVKHLDKATEELRKAQTKKEEAETAAAYARAEQEKASTRLAEGRKTALEKTGGKGAGVPKTRTVTTVQAALQKKFGSTLDPNAAKTYADRIAPEVERLIGEEGYSEADAVETAVQNAIDSGQISGNRRPRLGPGTSVRKPLALPESINEMQDNMIYDTPEGPRTWSAKAKGFVKPSDATDE